MPAENKAHKAKRAAALQEIKKILPLIDRIKKEHQGTNWSGIEICPICQQSLRIHHFREMGKTWGRCETRNCVAWMVSLVLGIVDVASLLSLT